MLVAHILKYGENDALTLKNVPNWTIEFSMVLRSNGNNSSVPYGTGFKFHAKKIRRIQCIESSRKSLILCGYNIPPVDGMPAANIFSYLEPAQRTKIDYTD